MAVLTFSTFKEASDCAKDMAQRGIRSVLTRNENGWIVKTAEDPAGNSKPPAHSEKGSPRRTGTARLSDHLSQELRMMRKAMTSGTRGNDICPVCGGDGGIRGGCYKCDGTGWV